ncbi:hypothetical protein SAMN05192541_14651 [Bradyrhizobium arachidis]|nr:hypothetical protein SAMN05192541_14651 [Bradyrhizobium arachidis]
MSLEAIVTFKTILFFGTHDGDRNMQHNKCLSSKYTMV